jgi:hypothetical protein
VRISLKIFIEKTFDVFLQMRPVSLLSTVDQRMTDVEARGRHSVSAASVAVI